MILTAARAQLIFDSQAVWEEVYNNKDLDCRSREQMAFEIIPIVEHDPAGSGYKLERVGTLSGSETRMDTCVARALWPLARAHTHFGRTGSSPFRAVRTANCR